MAEAESEQQRVERAIAGDVVALNRLLLDSYRRLHARILKKIPARLQTLVAPEDIIQESLAEAYRSIKQFRPTGDDSFFRWLAVIADHRLVDAIRAQRAAKRGGDRTPLSPADRGVSSVATLIDLLAVSEHTPSRSARGHEAGAAIQVALASLSPDYRKALQLRYLESLPVAAVAARMGRTESAIHKLCSRALLDLRSAMGEAAQYLSRA